MAIFLGDETPEIIIGTAEADLIHGARGNDTLTGGAGMDIFDYGKFGPGDDIITDFQRGEDKINLRADGPYTLSYDFLEHSTLLTFQGGSVELLGVFITWKDIIVS